MLDRSASMRAHDVAPSRFARATAGDPDLPQEQAGEHRSRRAGRLREQLADPVVPDARSRHRRVLPGLDRGAIRRTCMGTNIGAALKNALEVARKDDRKTRKIFVLLSDGEDYGGEAEPPARGLPAGRAPHQQHRHRVGRRGAGAGDACPTAARFRSATKTAASSAPGSRSRCCASSRPTPAGATCARGPAATSTKALHEIEAGERKLVGYRTTTEYRDLYPGGAGAGRRRRSPPSGSSYDGTAWNSSTLNAQAAGEIVTGLEHEIGKVIVGQHTLIRRMLTALFAAIPFAVSAGTRAVGLRPRAARGRAGRRQDADGDDARAGDLGEVPAHPAHARPAARRHHRHAHLRREDGDVPHRAGPGLHQHPARRRDQPRHAEDAERAARGDAGAAGHARRHDVPARRSVLGARDAEPGRAGRRLHAARGAARSLLDDAARRLSEPGRGSRDAAGADEPDDDRAARLAVGRAPCCATSSTRRSTSTTRSSSTSSGSAARRAIRASVGRADLRELLLLGISPRSYQHLLALAASPRSSHGRDLACCRRT